MDGIGEYKLFFNIVKKFLKNTPNEESYYIEDVVGWDAIIEEFQNQSLSTLAIDSIKDLNLLVSQKKVWENEIIKQSAHFIKLLHVLGNIFECLNSKSIEWVVLKGPSAAIYYPNPMQRTIGDIDILVAKDDFDKAKECLEENNFKFGNNMYRYDRHVTAHKNDITIELHRFFASTHNEKTDREINNLLYDAISKGKQNTLNGITFNVLPDLENGIVLIEHIWHHINTGIGLRQLIDFIMYVDKVLDDDFWNNSFESVATKLKYETLCKIIARIGQMYFGLSNSISWCKDIDDNLANEFLVMVLNQGNFGHKTSKKFNPTIRVLNKKNESILSFLKYEQSSGMKNWEAAQKNKLLRPFAWIYGITRHISMIISSKEKTTNFISDYNESKRQANLLSKIRPD